MVRNMDRHWIRYSVNWSKPLLRAYKSQLWGLFFLMLFSVVLSLISVNFIQQSIDAIQAGDVNALFCTALLFTGVTSLKLLYEYLYGCHYEKVFVHMERDLQNRFVQKLLRSQMREIDGENSGELSNKCSSDISEALRFIRQGISNYLFNPIMMFGGFLYLFYYNHKLSLCVFLPIPIIAFFLNRMSGKVSVYWRKIQGLNDDYSEQIFDAVHGAEIIRAGNMQKLQHDKAGQILARILKENRQYNISIAITLALIMAVTYVPMVSAFIYGAYLVAKREIEVSLLFGYAQLINPICMPVINLFSSVVAMKKACQSMKRLDEVEAMKEERRGGVPLCLEGTPAVSFEKVSFAYRTGMPVIDQMDLCLKQGSCVGIVGESGAGKSTIMDLICGLYEIDEGELKLFGQDIKTLNLSDVREKIAYISQQTCLFPGTIMENLRLADPHADEDQIWAALVKAGMEESVSALPEGTQTMLSEKGDNLSGGQRQRLSLAQAFLRKAAVYIFDEPTASLDPDMEVKVTESILTLVREEKAASIIISHNPDTLRHCDVIYRLEAGKLQMISWEATL